MKKMMTAIKSRTGCGEMSNFTFRITVQEEIVGNDPMTEQDFIDYIILRLESQSVITVTNIVRDY
jgi:hypothetical protein